MFDAAYTSLLKRAIRTLWIVLDLNLKPIRHYYLADQETLNNAMNATANQGKTK